MFQMSGYISHHMQHLGPRERSINVLWSHDVFGDLIWTLTGNGKVCDLEQLLAFGSQ